MKPLLNANVYGWRMTGLLGKGGAWFFGYSRRPDAPLGVAAAPRVCEYNAAPGVGALPKCKDCPGRASLMCCENKAPPGVDSVDGGQRGNT